MTHSIQIGDYELGEPLGRGGMGRVWRARHVARQTDAALKIATSSHASRPDFLEEFEREVQAAASLNHPGVVTVYDYGQLDEATVRTFGGVVDVGAPWLAMSIAQMGTMEAHEPQSFRELRHVLLQLLDALAHSHARGVIHRDLKPSNLLVAGSAPSGPNIQLSDFGIAHVERPVDTPTPEQMNSSSAGTPLFMAPEQFRGDWRKFGPPTDLYAVGCISYYWVTGEPPFGGRNIVRLAMQHYNDPVPPIGETRFSTPDGFESWLLRLLAKDPRRRFSLAADAAWALLSLGIPRASGPSSTSSETGGAGISMTTLGEMTTQASDLSFADTRPSSADVEPGGVSDPTRESATPTRAFPAPPIPSTWRPVDVGGVSGDEKSTVGAGLFGLREVPFVDRNPQRDAIWNALQDIHRDERPRSVILHGLAGCGKSKLAGWMSARALETGAATTLTVLNSEGYGADEFAWALGRHLRIMGLEPDAAREAIRASLPTLGEPMSNVLLRLLAPVLELPAGKRRDGVPQSMRLRCLQTVLAAMSDQRPVVLWLDDAQWADEGLELAQRLLENDQPSRVLVLLTVRDGALEEANRARSQLEAVAELSRATSLEVGELGHDDEVELVRGMLDLAPRLVEEVVRRSDGNPLFAVQLVGDWVQRDCLVSTAVGLDVTHERELTRTGEMADIWTRRLDSLYEELDDRAPEALRAGAALGVTVRQDEWYAVLDELDIDVPRRLVSRLALERLAKRHEEGWAFVHGLLANTLVAEAKQAGTWQRINAACAKTLRGRYASPNTFQANRVARHYREAGMLDEASEWFIVAGREARATEHFPEMFENLDALTACLDELGAPDSDVRRGWSRFLDIVARFNERPLDETGELAGQLIADATDENWGHVGIEARMAAATALSGLGEFERARQLGEEATKLYEGVGNTVDYARALGKLGFITWHTRRPQEARRLCEASLDIQLDANDKSGQARNYDRLAYMWREESPDKATAYYEQALPLAREQGMIEEQAHILDGIAHLARQRGDNEAARRGFVEAARTFATIESPAEYMSKMNLALLEMSEGAFDRAVDVLGESIDVFEEYGVLTYAMHARAARLNCRLVLGEPGAEQDMSALESSYERTPTHTPPILENIEAAIPRCSNDQLLGRLRAFADIQREGLQSAEP